MRSLDNDAALMESINCEVKLAALKTLIDKGFDGMGTMQWKPVLEKVQQGQHPSTMFVDI